jgi:hypothetical protein
VLEKRLGFAGSLVEFDRRTVENFAESFESEKKAVENFAAQEKFA